MLRLVDTYKHLGSILAHGDAPGADTDHRLRSAKAAYMPIVAKVFGARSIARPVRLRLFTSLVLSRLIYNVHAWSFLHKDDYVKMNALYMRGLRMITGNFKAGGSVRSDSAVRLAAGMPSLQALISQRRLLLFSAVLRHGGDQLHALLSVRQQGGARLPWVNAVIADMRTLAAAVYPRLRTEVANFHRILPVAMAGACEDAEVHLHAAR